MVMNVNLKELSIKLADQIASFIGSWTFIIIQSTILTIWILINVIGLVNYDPYPFILLNLFLSFEAAYATPLILMSSTRQAEQDRIHLMKDVALDQESNLVIKKLAEDIRIDKTALEYIIKAKDERHEMRLLLEEIREILKK
jgi:uncharacterized membrane protein